MNDHRKNRLSALSATAACVLAATGFAAGSVFAATCESLACVAIPFTTITTAQTVTGGTFAPPTGAAITGLPDFCRVALVMAPGYDYHWYRKGRNGYWTHKPGGTPATNIDNSGNLIPDPRTADRGVYTQFCTFMVVMHGHIKLKGPYC